MNWEYKVESAPTLSPHGYYGMSQEAMNKWGLVDENGRPII